MKLLSSLETESKAIVEDVIVLSVYANQDYNSMWNLTFEEKKIFLKILKDKISLDRGIKPKEILTQERF